jgi:hypothetical protein
MSVDMIIFHSALLFVLGFAAGFGANAVLVFLTHRNSAKGAGRWPVVPPKARVIVMTEQQVADLRRLANALNEMTKGERDGR